MTNNKQTYDWTKSGSFIKMIDNNKKNLQNQLLKGPIARAPKSRSGYYPDRAEADPIDLTRRYTPEESNTVDSYWKKRQKAEKEQEAAELLYKQKQEENAQAQFEKDYRNSLIGKLDPYAQSSEDSKLKIPFLFNLFTAKEMLGSFLDNSTQVHGQNIIGRIQDEDQATLEAEAHKSVVQDELNLQNLIRQRDLHEETSGKDDVYYQFQQQIADNINKIKNRDKTITELDEAYKERYVTENSNIFERLSMAAGSLTAWGEEGLKQFRDNIRRKFNRKSKENSEKALFKTNVNNMSDQDVINAADKLKSQNLQIWQTYNQLNRYKNNIADKQSKGLNVAQDVQKYSEVLNKIRQLLGNNESLSKQLYAETNPDYFLGEDTPLPEEYRNHKNLKSNPELLKQYKINLAKEKIASGKFDDKSDQHLYDDADFQLDAQLKQADLRIKQGQAVKKELQEDYDNTMQWQNNFKNYVGVSQGYKSLEQIHQDDFLLNPNYWIYCMPGTMGSSNSSPEGLIGTIIQYGSILGGPIGAAAGTIVSTPFQIKSGLDENYAETADKYLQTSMDSLRSFGMTQEGVDKFYQDLQTKAIAAYKDKGFDDEWIKEHCDISNDQGKKNLLSDLYSGIITTTDPRIKGVQVNAMRGLQAMREADNMRTMGQMPFEIGFQLLPVDRILRNFSRISRTNKDSRILSRTFLNRTTDKNGRLVATTAGRRASSETLENEIASGERYANGFRKPRTSAIESVLDGMSTGATIGESGLGLGVVGGLAGGLVGGATKATGQLVKHILPKQQRAFVEAAERAIVGKYRGVYDKLLPTGSFKRAAAKYGIPAVQRLTANSLSEATEEGVQYLNSNKDFSQYGFSGATLGDLVINDWNQGSQVTKAYMSLLGLGDSELENDLEFWNNVKGGFALGGGHAGIIQLSNAARDAYYQYKTDDMIINSSLMNRYADSVSRINDKSLAQLAMEGKGEYAIETLNDMERRDRDSENPQYTQEDYDYKKKQLRNILAITNNNNVRSALEAHGIEYGTEKYAAAVADIANIRRGIDENVEQSREVSNNINLAYNSKEYKDALDQAVNEMFVSDVNTSLAYSAHIIQYARDYVDKNLGEKRDGKTDQQYEQRRKELYNKGKQEAEIKFKEGVDTKTKLVNKLGALLQLRAQQNSIEDYFKVANEKFNIHVKRPDANLIRKNIDKQIKEIKDLLFKNFKSDFNGVNINKITDADLLTHLDGIGGVVQSSNKDELMQLLKADAMLQADADVLTKHDLRLSKGLVKDKDGKYVYNPARYQYERDLERQKRKALKEGKEFTEKPFEESGYGINIAHRDPYLERIERILKTDAENEAINWMVEDIYNGDGINELIKDDEKDYSDKDVYYGETDLLDIKEKEKSAVEADQKPSDETSTQEQQEHKGNLREARRRAAKRKWRERRQRMRKNRRSNAHVDATLGILPMLAEISTYFLEGTQLATYSIQEFIEDIKASVGTNWKDEYIPQLKRLYAQEKAKGFVNQMMSQKAVTDENKSIQDRLKERNSKIIPEISSFYHTFVEENGTITMYSNRAWESIRKEFGERPYLSKVAHIKSLLNDQTKFDEYLKQVGLEKYSKYRTVKGIEEAIAKEVDTDKRNLSVAVDVRNAVIEYITTGTTSYRFEAEQDKITELYGILNRMRDYIAKNNLQIIDTSQMLYGIDRDGNNITTQADLMFVDPFGNVYVWDVVQSYKPITEHLDEQVGKSYTTSRERIYLDNKELYDILSNTLGASVSQILIIPIQYDVYSHFLNIEKSINVKPSEFDSISYHAYNAEKIDANRIELVNNVNEAVDQYNELAEILGIQNRFDNETYTPSITAIDAYMDQERLDKKSDDVTKEYEKLLEKINQQNKKVDNEQSEYFGQLIMDLSKDEQYGIDLVGALSSVCRDLDIALSNFSFIGNITQDDANMLEYICNKVYDAQKMLNDVLQNEYASKIDTTKEQQLIASTMEQLYKIYSRSNSDIKYKVGILQKWWLNNIENLNSDKILEKLTQFKTALISREADGKIHLIDDITGDTELQSWYSTILNIYYKNLLTKASDYITQHPDQNQQTISNLIQDGFTFIQMFNNAFKTSPIEELSMSEINAIDTSYKDQYNTTTAVHPSRNAMFKQGGRYWQSVSNYIDLIENGNFELVLDKDGNVALHIKYKTGYKTYEFEFPFYETQLTDSYIYNENVAPFVDKVKKMLEYKKTHPNAKITFDVFRNRGSVYYNTGTKNNVLNFLLKKEGKRVDDLFAFTMNAKTRFGVLKIIHPTGKEQGELYSVVTGENFTQQMGAFDDVYNKQQLQLRSGTIIYNYDTGKNDLNGQNRFLKVALNTQEFGPKMGQLLAQALVHIANGGSSYYGFSKEAVLDMLNSVLYIRKEDDNKNLSVFNSLDNAVIIRKGQIQIGNDVYNVMVDADRNNLINRLSQMHFQIQKNTINQFFSTWKTPLMDELKQRFQKDDSLQKIELPIGLTITREDFTHPNYGTNSGTTLFGYLLRNTIIYTDATDLRYAEINVDNVVLTEDTPNVTEDTLKNAPEQSSTSPIISENQPQTTSEQDDQLSIMLGGLFMTEEDGSYILRTESEYISFKDKAEAYLNKVLGKNGEVKFGKSDEVFLGAFHDRNVLAVCGTQFILMSRNSPEEAIFHEAFHKVLELLVPKEMQEEFYAAYRKKYGENLSERDVAEGLCDEFVSYINNRKAYLTGDNVWKKIGNFFKFAIKSFSMFSKYGLVTGIRMFNMFNNTDKGKYATAEIKQERIQRYKEKFGDFLYYSVKNRDTGEQVEFESIHNSTELRETANALAFFILQDQGVLDDIRNAKDIVIDNDTAGKLLHSKKVGNIIKYIINGPDGRRKDIFNEVFESRVGDKEVKTKYGTETQRIFIFDKFNVIKPYINEAIYAITTAYDSKFKDDLEPSTDDDNVLNMNIDKFDRSAYEFSKLDSVTKQIKFFFSTIKYMTKNPKYDPNDPNSYRFVIDLTKNSFGLPQLMPLNEVFNVIVNDLGHVNSVEELYQELKSRAAKNPMYAQVFQKFDTIYNEQYVKDENGNIVDINYDNEALITQLFSAVKSQRIGFYIVMSETDSDGNKSSRLVRSGFDEESRRYPSNWEQNLLNGVVNIFSNERTIDGKYKFKEHGLEELKHAINTLIEIQKALQKLDTVETVIDGEKYILANTGDIDRLKDTIIKTLNSLGIMFTKEALNHKLFEEYGDDGKDILNLWLNSGGNNYSLTAFINRLNEFVNQNGEIQQNKLISSYIKSGFVKDLGNWQGIYNSVTIQNMSLGLDGKKLYGVSQNHTISHIVNQLQSAVGGNANELINTLSNFAYNCIDSEFGRQGSILLKALSNSSSIKFDLGTYIGFKTDMPGDVGKEFKSEPEIEDYIAKLTMLQEGAMIFPTLADKGTWTFLELNGDYNIRIPGMTYESIEEKDEDGIVLGTRAMVRNRPSVRNYIKNNGTKVYYMRPVNEVLDQFIEYAKCEVLAIQRCMEDLGYDEIDGYTKTGRHVLKENEKVKNYHTGELPNGTRFLTLTKLVIPYKDQNGVRRIREVNLNDPNKSSNEMLKLANKEFFNKSHEEQQEIIAATLAIQNELAIQKAISLGLIKKEDGHLTNIHLNDKQVNALHGQFYQIISKYTGLDEKLATDFAIMALLGDVTNRSIISSEECERCFSGHPGMFKVKYDRKKGIIKDSTSDKQKRIGGMISTGDDNRKSMPGLRETYTCAECNDYETNSKADVYDKIADLFETSQLREAYGNFMQNDVINESKIDGLNENNLIEEEKAEYEEKLKKIWDDAYKLDIEEIKKALPEEIRNKAISLAKAFASAYDDGINVADGAAYITEDMCANLLRKRGAFTQEVKEAFDILKDESQPWVHKYEAYKKIFEATTIVTTKYTAYGTRPLNYKDENGDYQQTDVAVTYYNKFALFPLFECIATGKMKGIYDKMRNENVDMLLMTSAIKIGSQGAVSYNGNEITDKFNTYEQSYDFLRRQLNTDSEEEHEIAFGTQMVKIALSNLRLYRNNYKVGDKTMTGMQIRDTFMDHINELAKLGVQKFRNRFYDESGNLDPKKVSDYLRDQLTSRNANRSLIEALDMITDPITGGLKQSMPLAATMDSSWIESIIISSANSDIINIVTPGNSFVQRSVFAMEREDGKGAIEGAEYYNGQKLEMINEDKSMDAVISIDYFEDILPKGLSFKEQRQFLIDHGIIGGPKRDKDGNIIENGVSANTIGYRIPTQAQSSIHALRFIDVIPAVKSTIILPQEFTKITGSD